MVYLQYFHKMRVLDPVQINYNNTIMHLNMARINMVSWWWISTLTLVGGGGGGCGGGGVMEEGGGDDPWNTCLT